MFYHNNVTLAAPLLSIPFSYCYWCCCGSGSGRTATVQQSRLMMINKCNFFAIACGTRPICWGVRHRLLPLPPPSRTEARVKWLIRCAADVVLAAAAASMKCWNAKTLPFCSLQQSNDCCCCLWSCGRRCSWPQRQWRQFIVLLVLYNDVTNQSSSATSTTGQSRDAAWWSRVNKSRKGGFPIGIAAPEELRIDRWRCGHRRSVNDGTIDATQCCSGGGGAAAAKRVAVRPNQVVTLRVVCRRGDCALHLYKGRIGLGWRRRSCCCRWFVRRRWFRDASRSRLVLLLLPAKISITSWNKKKTGNRRTRHPALNYMKYFLHLAVDEITFWFWSNAVLTH